MLTPRTNTELFGHQAAEAELLRGLSSGAPAHGIIIGGPRGIGKATLAYRFARALLASSSPPAGGGNTAARIAANSHADLLVIEPEYDEKKEEFANEITVGQARRIPQFMAMTPGEGQWRLVIIDPADALNASAANALLKILEEPPPQAVLLLVSHNPGRLLPTIRSRCRTLRMAPLSTDDFTAAVRHVAPETENLRALAALSACSPGVALEMGQGALGMYADLLALLSGLPQLDASKIHAFADTFSGSGVHMRWRLLRQSVLHLFGRAARQAAGAPVEPVSGEEAAALRTLVALHPAGVWAAKWQNAAGQFSLAEARHLDYKQAFIEFAHTIADKELPAAGGQ
ncbi:MAG: DNA polymerase III subunit delta' [Pseudomonadota bacterium]|nr:DNA polymerase III subunit delta' [Pseudomonadota bacterium]MDE3037916.1 DNA polymerase III subunit delta' [Pseudomonadota bacterium]